MSAAYDPEQQFFAWAGRIIAAGFFACIAWLFGSMWSRVYKIHPGKLEALERRLTDEFATKPEVERMETLLREALKEQGEQFREAIRQQAEQRREMHGENGRRMDTMIDEIRLLRTDVQTGLARAHERIDALAAKN